MDETAINYDAQGLVPCVVQDWDSGEVLTLAYMNAEALKLTQQTQEAHFWSRSRQELWHKGATSGHILKLRAMRYDCDGDAIVALVEPTGPACHTGNRTCFYRGDMTPPALHEVLPRLERTIEQRRASHAGSARHGSESDGSESDGSESGGSGSGGSGSSYTAQLLNNPPFIGEKVQEEAEEVARAAREESDDRVANEAADVLYHLSVLLASRDLSLRDAERILDERSR